jgi:hypothetical protein
LYRITWSRSFFQPTQESARQTFYRDAFLSLIGTATRSPAVHPNDYDGDGLHELEACWCGIDDRWGDCAGPDERGVASPIAVASIRPMKSRVNLESNSSGDDCMRGICICGRLSRMLTGCGPFRFRVVRVGSIRRLRDLGDSRRTITASRTGSASAVPCERALQIAAKGPVEILVIDPVERPDGN